MKITTKLLLRSSLAMALSSVSTFALAQENGVLDLGTIVLRGEKLNVSAEDATPNISVITEDQIANPGNSTILSVLRGQPNVIVDEDATIPTIRGISSTVNTNQVFGSGVLPRVPILIDDVATPVAQSTGYLSSSAWDVNAVEVARGPQPTSTGRNAFSGAIRVYTNDPTFEQEAAVRLGFSDLRDVNTVAFMFNQPFIADQLAIRVSGERRAGDTLVRVNDPRVVNVNVNELEYENIRAKVRYAPAHIPGFELKLTYDFQSTRDQYAPVVGFGNSPSQLFINNFIGFGGYDITRKETYIYNASYEFSEDSTLFFRASRADSLLRNPFVGSLGLAGFRELGSLSFENEETEFEAYYQFANLGAISNGVVGIIYNDSSEVVDNNPAGLANVFFIDVNGSAENIALYGEIEWDLGGLGVPGLTLITGGRLERDERTRLVFADGNLQASQTFKEEVFLPKLGVRYEPSDTLEFGYTYSESFRPGGLEVDLVSGFAFPIGAPGFLGISPFVKEEIQNHEIYVKKSLMDDQLNLGATYFYYIYDNAQVVGASAVPSAFPGFFLTGNVPEAVGQGVEVTADYAGGNGFGVNASLGWLDTEITNAGPIAAAFQGSDLPNAPEFSASFGVSYDHPTAGWDAFANVRFVDSMTNTLGGPPLSSYTVLDVGAGYDFTVANGTDMRVDLNINNLTDEAYFTENAGALNIAGRPREILLNLTARF